ncbi:MAG TPA: DUF6152 family protein [Bryobacteraceae bacterium]|nr:DUF6152 family protein [Bryobacteraceae bacterium]
MNAFPAISAWAVMLFAGALFTVAPLSAHHSFAAEFDSAKPIRLAGKVTKVDWTNPHVFLYVDVADRSGKVINWRVESAAPNGLLREGWTKESLKAGDAVIIDAFLAKDEENFAKTTSVTLPGGRRVYTGYADERGPNTGSPGRR